MKTPDFRMLVHTPAELAAEHLTWAEGIQKSPGIRFGVRAIDEKVIPMRPGDLVSIIGRPGMGKSSLMAYIARLEAQNIVARGAVESEAVVYVTWEQSAEELEAFFQSDGQHSVSDIAWGRVDLDEVRAKAMKRAGLPIWVIGHGIGRAGKLAPRMTPEAVLNAIETMRADFGVKPVLMLFDYMQLIPVDGKASRVEQVTEVPIRVKEVALRVGAPAVVGVQAGRNVDTYKVKLPEMTDAQWASSIEQTSDKIFSLWRPCKSESEGSMIECNDKMLKVTETLVLIRLLKQRGDRGRFTWPLYFAPQYLALAELELRQYEP